MTTTNAQTIREQRARRTATIRMRVILGAVALFVTVWLVIAVVLVSGHDPALAKRTPAATQSASSGGSTSSNGGASTSSSAGTSTSSSSGASSSPSSVTTQQS